MKEIIELHEGIMEIVSNPGEGTVIRLIFPLVSRGMTKDGRRKVE